MILVGLGANLCHPRHGSPRATLEAALRRLAQLGVSVEAISRWYSTAPQPPSEQPRYVNAVAAVATGLGPEMLLRLLHRVEAEFGRVRSVRNAPRAIDLDLLDYNGEVCDGPEAVLPHPRLQQRAFVLLPLADLAPCWRHPVSCREVAALIAALPSGQDVRLADEADQGCASGSPLSGKAIHFIA